VVVGDQSSGKSSLLESLTGIPFPHNLELCTRYATQITSRRDSVSRVEVAIIPGPSVSEAHRARLEGYRPTVQTAEDLHVQFPGILAEVRP
jgi:GTPase SAR1 family protein